MAFTLATRSAFPSGNVDGFHRIDPRLTDWVSSSREASAITPLSSLNTSRWISNDALWCLWHCFQKSLARTYFWTFTRLKKDRSSRSSIATLLTPHHHCLSRFGRSGCGCSDSSDAWTGWRHGGGHSSKSGQRDAHCFRHWSTNVWHYNMKHSSNYFRQ